tara:strand:- start:417 stop:707 length:291 start_codon:yes stop_codon:yes gene_type:complete
MGGDEGSKHRFGAFPAAEVLSEIVAGRADASVSRRVTSLLQDFNEGLNAIAAIESRAIRQRLALLWRDDFLARAEIDPEVDKFLRNVISTHYKGVL